MKSPNNVETEPQLDICFHQLKCSVLGVSYIFLSCWPKEFHKNPLYGPCSLGCVSRTVFASQLSFLLVCVLSAIAW